MNIQMAFKNCIDQALLERAKTTANTYQFGLKSFAEFLATQEIQLSDDLEKIKMDHFIAYPPYLIQNTYSKQTRGVYISAVKYFMDWMVLNQYLQPGYYESLRYTKANQSSRKKNERRFPRIPEKDAADHVVKAVELLKYESPIHERNLALVLFLQSSGCRNNETVQLTIKNCDIKERRAVVVGKGSKERSVYFSRRAANALDHYWTVRGNREPSSPVFARHDKGASNKILKMTTTTTRNIIGEISMMAGIEKGKFTPHSFRHAFAIKVLRETGNLALVQDMLGHADPAATRVYATIYPDELRDAHREVFK